MTEQQLPKLVATLVQEQRMFLELSKNDAQWVIQNPGKSISLFIMTIKSRRQETGWIIDDEGNIHFMLTSNGFSCEQWEQYLTHRGLQIGDHARQVLRCVNETPTNGVTYNIVVRPGKKISVNDRISKRIRAVADKKGWVKPHWEVACLIHDTFTDEQLVQMGLGHIITMHEPIKDSCGDSCLLGSYMFNGARWLHTSDGRPEGHWQDDSFAFGYAFAVPQVGPQT